MATFNVFVEGPVDDSPTALSNLAEAMSKRYGLPASELVARFRRGRFRVKSNLDATTAERYRRDLESIGARVVIEDSMVSPTATPVAGTPVRPSPMSLSSLDERPATPPEGQPAIPAKATMMGGLPARGPAARPTPPSGLAAAGPQYARPATPGQDVDLGLGPAGLGPAGHASAAPGGPQHAPSPTGPQHARPSTPLPTGPQHARPATPLPTGPQHARPATPLPTGPQPTGPQHARPATPLPESGLSAAFAPASGPSDLGALSADGGLSLASLDGEAAPAAQNQFDLPPEPAGPVVTITSKPKSKDKDSARKKPSPSKAMDLFAPPDAGDQDLKVDIADEEAEERAKKKAAAPAELPVNAPYAPAAAPEPVFGTSVKPKPFSRERFLSGVVLALVVGFVPAHFVANMREKSAFAAIDRKIEQAHDAADSTETYLALDAAREKFLDEKQSARTMIALTSMLLWAAISAGVGFAFFRFSPPKPQPKQA